MSVFRRVLSIFALLWAGSLLLPAADAQQPASLFDGQRPAKPVACAHRGRLSFQELENSVTVMRHTFSQGIPMVEFDLQESQQGTIFLSHDPTLERTTNATGLIAADSDLQLSHVSQVAPGTREPVEPLARFEDLLVWAQGTTVELMVDLKGAPPADAVAALRRHGLVGRAVLLTFDARTAAAALASDPQILVSLLASTPQQIDAAVATAHGHPVALYLPGSADATLFAYAGRTGRPVITDAMDTLDDQAALHGPQVYRDYLKTHPADVLVSNRGEELLQALGDAKP